MSRCTVLGVFLASTSLSIVSLGSPTSRAFGDDNVDIAQAPRVAQRSDVIVGGTDVPPGKWPDTVAILGDTGVCTGTLIAPDVVLTAGHCAENTPHTVVANTTDYNSSGGADAPVSRTVAYPNWENTYDVAVIVLAEPITSVTPRRIGTSCTFSGFSPNVMVRIVGFGATDTQGEAANTQLKEAMTAVTDPTCSGGNGCNTAVAPGGEFVAGGAGTADSCSGDSGGPVYLDTPGGPIVIGVVSRSVESSATPCGGGGIYVRTDKIVEWIEATAGKAIMKDECAAGGDGSGSGSGFGSGSGTGEEGDDGVDPNGDVVGGCSVGGSGSGATLAFVAVAFGLALRRCRGVAERVRASGR